MELERKIKLLLDELIMLRMNKGISPWELMENIKTEEYKEIRAKKSFDTIKCNVIFYDTEFFEDKRIKYEYIYNYDKDMNLQEINILKNKQINKIWDKKEAETKLLDDIIELIQKIDNSKDNRMKKFVDSLPKDLKDLLEYKILNNIS